MTSKRQGQVFVCKHCGDEFYRRPSHVRRGITKSCGKSMCKSAAMSGANNPFWGRNHSEEMRSRLSDMKTPKKARGPAKGSFTHTPEAKAAISASLREQWRLNRDKRLEAVAKATETQRSNRLTDEPRYRAQFTPLQRAEWTGNVCAWCDATDDLVLDHIIPVMAGGKNRRANAQTLCRRCNIWKVKHVDRPYVLAVLDDRGG